MQETTILYTSLSLILLVFAFKFLFQSKSCYKNLPPSPLSLPIIGYLHLLKQPVHRTWYKLSKKYGPIFSLNLGSYLMVVVSSPSLVEECFTKNDVVLANRPNFSVSKHIGYNHTILVSAPYGDHWRNLRRISTIDILSNTRINKFSSIRKDEIKRMLLRLSRDSRQSFAKVELKPILSNINLNNMLRMISGKRYFGDDVSDVEEAMQFREIISEVFSFSGALNPIEFLPILRWIDFGKYEKKLERTAKRLDVFMQGMVDQHRSKKEGLESKSNSTMIDHLLSLQESQPDYYTDQIIKGLIMVLIIAGIDTSSVTIEWIMSNLLNHPDVLKKVRAELDTQIGQERLIEETDLPTLQYLQCIIYETFRLYPAAPLLLPHKSSDHTTIGGYNIPCDTIVTVNAWAIHRDPKLWDNPTCFKPERFESGEDEAKKLITFGQGRRSCPGSNVAQLVLGLTLGSLIQCFEWERVSEKLIDMTEGNGLTMPKLEPLVAMCKARPIVNKVLFEAA